VRHPSARASRMPAAAASTAGAACRDGGPAVAPGHPPSPWRGRSEEELYCVKGQHTLCTCAIPASCPCLPQRRCSRRHTRHQSRPPVGAGHTGPRRRVAILLKARSTLLETHRWSRRLATGCLLDSEAMGAGTSPHHSHGGGDGRRSAQVDSGCAASDTPLPITCSETTSDATPGKRCH